jgi:hypothetical protein
VDAVGKSEFASTLGWLVGYTVSLALRVLTKENSFFVWVGVLVVLAANYRLRFGRTTWELVLATFLGPILGLLALIILAGGPDVLFGAYWLLVTKNSALPYAIKTGDGSWQRYLVDLLLVSPIILLLAIGAVFQINRTKRPELFLLMFIFGSYVVMCNVKYGMNLRYINMWDVPLCFLALGTLVGLIMPLQQRRNLVFALSIIIICTFEMLQYLTLFVEHSLHELATDGLLRALSILK